MTEKDNLGLVPLFQRPLKPPRKQTPFPAPTNTFPSRSLLSGRQTTRRSCRSPKADIRSEALPPPRTPPDPRSWGSPGDPRLDVLPSQQGWTHLVGREQPSARPRQRQASSPQTCTSEPWGISAALLLTFLFPSRLEHRVRRSVHREGSRLSEEVNKVSQIYLSSPISSALPPCQSRQRHCRACFWEVLRTIN